MQVIYDQQRPGLLSSILKSASTAYIGGAIGDMFDSANVADAAKATSKATATASAAQGGKLSGLLGNFGTALAAKDDKTMDALIPQIHAMGGTNINKTMSPEQLGTVTNNLNTAMQQWESVPNQKGTTWRGGSWINPTPWGSVFKY